VIPLSAAERVLSPGEFALIAGVGAPAVTNWADAGRLTVRFTLGGNRRFMESEARGIADGTFRCAGCGYHLGQCSCLLRGAAARAS
jgi:hypothetical protein